jgi:Flp pilus assembly pilin Flp
MTHDPSHRRSESGQTMAEYAVVLALITLAVAATFVALGDGVVGLLTSLAGQL